MTQTQLMKKLHRAHWRAMTAVSSEVGKNIAVPASSAPIKP